MIILVIDMNMKCLYDCVDYTSLLKVCVRSGDRSHPTFPCMYPIPLLPLFGSQYIT